MMLVPDKHGANDDPPMTTPVALATSDDGRNWPCTVYLANVVNLARLHGSVNRHSHCPYEVYSLGTCKWVIIPTTQSRNVNSRHSPSPSISLLLSLLFSCFTVTFRILCYGFKLLYVPKIVLWINYCLTWLRGLN